MKRLFLISFLAINIFAAYAQSFILRGTVVDKATNETLAGVTVLIKGTTIETVTDLDGLFALKVPDITKHKIIVFSYAGYKKQEYTLNTAKNDIRITMAKEEVIQKTEIVVNEDSYISHTDDMAKSVDADIASSSKEEGVYLDEVAAVAYASEKGKGYTGSSSAIYGSRSASEDVKIRGTATKSPPAKPAPPPPTSTSDYRVAITSSSPYSNIKSGTLTAGEVNDFAKWHLWGYILKKDFISYSNVWGFKPINRYIAQLTNTQGMPIENAQVTLKNGENTIWQAKTDNTGKAELWVDFFKSEKETDRNNLKLVFEYEGKTTEITNVTPFEQGINTAQIDTKCSERNKVDIFFMVDATGSMKDEMRYLQVELDDIIKKIHEQQSELELRVGALVYRDIGDEYVTRKTSLNSDVNKTLDFIRKQSAGGGGDYPEAVDAALYESIEKENWNDDALARILFIILDAPSHTNPENIARLESQMRLAAAKGIRIVPIACSDIKKDGEYLMRTFALATNGTYLFLTDDSGVGNAHIKPTTDKYEVEKLNDAIVRVIKQYTKMPDCENQEWAEQNKEEEPSDKFVPNPSDEKPEKNISELAVSDVIKIYPNPCSSILKVDVNKSDVQDIYLVDMTGKVLYGYKVKSEGTIDFDVYALSTGIYFVKAFYKGKWFSEKVIKI